MSTDWLDSGPLATMIDMDPVYVRVTSNDRIVIPAAIQAEAQRQFGRAVDD